MADNITAAHTPDHVVEFAIGLSPVARRRHWLAELAQRCTSALGSGRAARRAGWVLQPVYRHEGMPDGPSGMREAGVPPQWLQLRCARGWPADPAQACAALAEALGSLGNGLALLSAPRASRAAACPAATLPQAGRELRLNFHTPLLVARDPHGQPDLPAFLAMVKARHHQVFGRVPQALDDAGALHALWHLAEPWMAPAGSRSTDALLGAVFLRDPPAPLAAALAALQPWHLVPPDAALPVDWRGAYTLCWQTKPWLDAALPGLRSLATIARLALDGEDTPPVADAGGGVLSPVALARQIMVRLKSPQGYAPTATTAHVLHRPGRAPRIVEQLATDDLVLQRHLLQLLSPAFERLFTPSSFGYRAGLGREHAVGAVRAALREGFVHVLEADISQCFASIGHAALDAVLDRALLLCDHRLRTLLHTLVRQPRVMDGTPQLRTCGLAQGAPLSPLLTNLFLTRLDQTIDPTRLRLVRYADDFVVLARSRGEAQEALKAVRGILAGLGLALAEHKTAVTHLRDGFRFLGEAFHPHALEPEEAAQAAQRKPLLVTEPYLQLGVNGAALEARRAGRLVGTWPMRRINGLIVTARCNLSSALLERCAQHDVALALAQQGGKRVSVLAPAQRVWLAAQHAHATWHHGLGAGARLGLAQAVLDAKLHNHATWVRQRAPGHELADTLAEVRRAACTATSTDALRGHEGHAARLCLRWLQLQLLPDVRAPFASRGRARGAPDRLNSALNFSYHLLYARLNALVRLRGLNPYLGWLHDAADDDYETLVYDLMEPFRPFIDRLLVRLINRQALRAQHFEPQAGAHWLTREGQRLLAEAVERMFGERAGRHRLRDLMWTQVRSVADLVAGSGPLWVFHWPLRGEDEAMPAPEPAMLTLDDDDPDDDATAAHPDAGEPA